MILFWAAATVVFIVVELATVGLASIWFALGALCALIAAALGAQLWLQLVLFFAVSVITLILTRPLVKKYINGKTHRTNADRVLGTTAVVKEPVDNLAGTGTVFADGKLWSARSADGAALEPGTLVTVLEIQGVKLIVKKAE